MTFYLSHYIFNSENGKNDVSYADTLTDNADFLRSIETGKPTREPLEVGYNVYLLTMMGLISITLGTKFEIGGRPKTDNDINSI